MLLATFFLLLTSSFDTAASQQPRAFSYLAKAFDEKGDLITRQDISVRVTLLADGLKGEVLYSEEHQVSTDAQGLFTLLVGKGNKIHTKLMAKTAYPEKIYMKLEISRAQGHAYRTLRALALPMPPNALCSTFCIASKT